MAFDSFLERWSFYYCLLLLGAPLARLSVHLPFTIRLWWSLPYHTLPTRVSLSASQGSSTNFAPSPQEQDKGFGDQSTPEDITKAKEAIAAGLKAMRETS